MHEAGVVVGAVLALAIAFGWEFAWKRRDAKVAAKNERIASCPHSAIYFTSLYELYAAGEWTRWCASCGAQWVWGDEYPPVGALVKTKKRGNFHYKPRKPHDQ